MKKYLLITICSALLLVGCGNISSDNQSANKKESKKEIMNVSLEQIEKIDLYEKGECTNISSDSKEFLDLISVIEENEYTGKDGKGKATVTDSIFIVPEGMSYAEYTEAEGCRIYIVRFKEKQSISYAGYSSKRANVDEIFIIPEKNMFGIIIIDQNDNSKYYETFMDVEKNIFE